MLSNEEHCSTQGCGCHLTVFSTNKECPDCGRRLRLAGRSHLAEFRLSCQECDYQSPLLSQEELQVLL